VALLSLSLSFPDQVPNRFRVAIRAGNRKRTHRLLTGQEALSHDVDDAIEQVLELTAALSVHDRRTRGHAERVRAYADLLAEELHLGLSEREQLRWAALLHDIGKLHVPASILNKPGKPTDTEWEILRSHPIQGEQFVQPLGGWLGEWSRAVGEHHERFDGMGYPRGLKGEEISLAARMVAVCDTFEVITAARAYKKPMPASVALAEIMRQSGRQFDPRVVRAFLNLSIPKLRRTIGPLALAAQLPFLSPAGAVGTVAPGAIAAAGAASVSAALVVSGAVAPPPTVGTTFEAIGPEPGTAMPAPDAWASSMAVVADLPVGPVDPAAGQLAAEIAAKVERDIATVLEAGSIRFDSDSATIAADSTGRLDEVAALLLAEPTVRVQIAGHTDAIGDEQENLRLSEQRAAAVKEYLIGRNVDRSRMTVVGYGESQPVASNDDEAGRLLNRRIEFSTLG
jgi:putative nucleotidyltransferase with HDIG domain